MNRALLAIIVLLNATSLMAGEADVVKATVNCNTDCSFHVTVRHDDEGWDHYADKWDILDSNGKVIATRTLHHPHVNEQPFTRNLIDVSIPTSVETVTIRAHDSVHGYGGEIYTLNMPSR